MSANDVRIDDRAFIFLRVETRGCNFDRAAGFEIDVARPGHLPDVLSRQQFAAVAIQYIEEPVLGRLHHDLSLFPVDSEVRQDHVGCRVVVPRVVRHSLIVPFV